MQLGPDSGIMMSHGHVGALVSAAGAEAGVLHLRRRDNVGLRRPHRLLRPRKRAGSVCLNQGAVGVCASVKGKTVPQLPAAEQPVMAPVVAAVIDCVPPGRSGVEPLCQTALERDPRSALNRGSGAISMTP